VLDRASTKRRPEHHPGFRCSPGQFIPSRAGFNPQCRQPDKRPRPSGSVGRKPTRVRRTLSFDPKTEQILHDPEAAALVRREYRKDHWAVSSGLESWTTLESFTNTYGIWQMIDTAATNDVTRFYRAVEEP